MTPDIKITVNINFDLPTKDVTETLDKWMTMPISLIRHVNVMKMALYPKCLKSISLRLPKSFFNTIHSIFSKLIWNNTKHRIRLRQLYLPNDREVPTFEIVLMVCIILHSQQVKLIHSLSRIQATNTYNTESIY